MSEFAESIPHAICDGVVTYNHWLCAVTWQREAWNTWWGASDIWTDDVRVEAQRKSAGQYQRARAHVDAWLELGRDEEVEGPPTKQMRPSCLITKTGAEVRGE